MIELQALGFMDSGGDALGALPIPSFLLNARLRGCLMIIFFFSVFVVCSGSASTGTLTPVITFILFLLALVGLAYGYYRYTRSWVGPAQLFASAGRLQRGTRMDFTVKQPTLRETTYDRIAIQIGVREWVRYRCGTDTCTDTYDQILFDSDTQGMSVGADGLMEYRTSFQLPPNLMHSFQASDNRISWFARVIIDIKGLPETAQYYQIDLDTER